MTTTDAPDVDQQGYHGVIYVPLDEIVSADVNPKEHDIPLIKRMLRKFGMGELPLRDERTGKLVAGHGRLEALRESHHDRQIPPKGIRVLDDGRWAMPMLTGWASESDDHARAYLVGSNQSTTVGGWDHRQLAEMLRDVDDVQLLDVTGFEESDIVALERALEDEGHRYGSGDDEGEEGDVLGLHTVVISCKTEAEQAKVLAQCTKQGWHAAAVTR